MPFLAPMYLVRRDTGLHRKVIVGGNRERPFAKSVEIGEVTIRYELLLFLPEISAGSAPDYRMK